MSTVNGFRRRRLSRGLTIRETAQLSGLSPYLIRRCEEGRPEDLPLSRLLALSSALGISISEGCRPAEPLGPRRLPRRHEPRNILERYMAYRELTVQSLAILLDVSPQTVSVQCGRDLPAMKYIRRLADAEDLSVAEFMEMFGGAPSCVLS